MKRILAGLLFALVASWASANDGYYDPYGSGGGPYDRGYYSNAYAGLSFGQLRYSEQGLSTITPATASVFIGARINPWVSIEGRLGSGLGWADTNGYGLEVRSVFAGYLKGSVPLAPGISIYGLGGVANVNMQRDFGIGYTDDTSFSYGVGMDFDLASHAQLGVEWTHLATGYNLGYPYDINQASIALAWRF
jgi:opacity protein-like surface antigen